MSSSSSSFLSSLLSSTGYSFYQNLSFSFILINVVVFIALKYFRAPYGRYTGAIPVLDILPDVHPTLAWTIMEIPCLFWATYNFFLSPDRDPLATASLPNRILLSMFVLHYVNRVFIFPYLIRNTASKFPLSMALFGHCWTHAMSYLQTSMLCRFVVYPEEWLWDPRFLIGTFLFFLGFYWNNQADAILRGLRKPGETGYKIPRGGMFEYVSGANFFSETLEWLGFAIATWGLGGFTFFFVTASNIMPRAVAHHKWYLEKFKGEYPKNRKAVIPFIW